ncbi:MAG: 2'-5' RNA ligase family protein [Spirochaetaceae bacterium]
MIKLDPNKVEASILVFPVNELIPHLQVFREKYTKDGIAGMPPHITLLYPYFPTVDDIDNNLNRIKKVCKKIEPFTVSIKNLGFFSNREVMYYAPEPKVEFKKIIKLFAEEFRETPPYGGAFPIDEISAHITVCTDKKFIDEVEKELTNKMKTILPFSFEVNLIKIYIKYDGQWIDYKTFDL